MAGSIRPLHSVSLIDATVADVPIPSSGAHKTATFLLHLTAITRTTGIVSVTLWWSPDGTAARGLFTAGALALSATGWYAFTYQTGQVGSEYPKLEPNLISWALVPDASAVSGTVYQVVGD